MEKEELNDDAERISGNKHSKKFIVKELLDKIGYGFSSQQFVNVLFFLSGANLFLIGAINGLKSVIGILLGTILREYDMIKGIGKRAIGFAGIFFGFSFLFMAIAKFFNSALIFSIALLLGGISVVIYADFSQKFFFFGKKGNVMEKIAKYGLIVTAASLFLSAYLIDKFSDETFFILTIMGRPLLARLPGYLVAFEIAAIAFIISGYFLATAKDKARLSEGAFSLSSFFARLRQKSGAILRNKFLTALMAFNIIVGLIQIVGNSYYGIFIYQNFRDAYFGGFLNIAVVFLIGVFSALIGYLIAKINTRAYGHSLMLFIGGLFLSAMPLAFYFGHGLALLTAGTMLGVIGASAIGVSTGMLVVENLHGQDRTDYYALGGMLSVIPYILFVPVLSYAAQEISLKFLFLVLGAAAALSAIAFPIIVHVFVRKIKS